MRGWMLVAVAATGCGKDKAADTGAMPEEVCRGAAAGLDGAFEDRTEAWGLAEVRGARMSVADLDGDGYPDLVVRQIEPFGRDDFTAGVRYHSVLMNRDDGAGGRTFVDETADSLLFAPREGDPAEIGRAASVVVFGDVDGDGDLDAFTGQFYDANDAADDPGDRSEIMLNNGDGTFAFGPEIDLERRGGYATAGASFADVDADGALDLWVTGWYIRYGYLTADQDRLFLGDGAGGFTDVTEAAGLEMVRSGDPEDWVAGVSTRPAYGATACDLDGDAFPDLLASNYARAWNQQWMNDGAGAFTDVGLESGFAADDDLDYSDNQFYRCWCEVHGCDPDPGPASLGDCETYADYWTPGFDDQPARLGGNTFSTACADVDNDGDLDLYSAEIAHWHIGGSSDPSELLLNDGTGSFSRPGNEADGLARDWPSNSWNAGDIYAALVDLDGDGWKDVLLASSDYPDTRMFLWRQVAPGAFEEVAEAAGIDHPWPAGLAVADFDRDGDLDVVTGSSTARSGTPWTEREVHFYENTLGPLNALSIRLEGTEANRAGIGARVEVEAGGLVQTFEVGGGYGHMGMQHDTVLTVGLGEACTAEDVRVTWPGGAADDFGAVRANYAVTLVQGGEVRYE